MSDVAAAVTEIIARTARLDPARLVPEAKLEDLKVESLDMVEIVFALEERFKIEIPLDPSEPQDHLKTVGDVVAAVERLVAARPAAG